MKYFGTFYMVQRFILLHVQRCWFIFSFFQVRWIALYGMSINRKEAVTVAVSKNTLKIYISEREALGERCVHPTINVYHGFFDIRISCWFVFFNLVVWGCKMSFHIHGRNQEGKLALQTFAFYVDILCPIIVFQGIYLWWFWGRK